MEPSSSCQSSSSLSLHASNRVDIEISLRIQLKELNEQLNQLNSKLVGSFERIANLEDELHESTQNHNLIKSRNKVLEIEAAEHEEALKGGLLVESADVQAELQRLTHRALQEAEKRSQSEASLSTINKELDDLSASLFSEANRLVAAEKLQRIKAERKVVEVEEAMKGVEEVIESRRDQLNDLRVCLENAERERDEYKLQLMAFQNPTHASDCGQHPLANELSQEYIASTSHPTLACNPTDTSSSIIASVLPDNNHDSSIHRIPSLPYTPGRSPGIFPFQQQQQIKNLEDILPFQEFVQFTRYLIRMRTDALARPAPQQNGFSESYYSAAAAMNNVTTNPSSTFSQYRHSMAGGLVKDQLNPISPKELLAPILPMSQHLSQAFIKRCIDEDSDPALRLDLAPGLNFLSRRSIFTALVDGHLVIEPVWSDIGAEFDKCSLCGCPLDRWFPARTSLGNAFRANANRTTSTIGSTSASSTMRKMLGGGGWTFGSLSRNKQQTATAGVFMSKPSNSSTSRSSRHVETIFSAPAHSATPSGRTSPTPEESEAVYVHTFRAADTSSNRYPICPTYCLGRLRSVCDFWTYVRSIECGLLLDESFRFARRPSQRGSRSLEPHSLGLAYDTTLKMVKQKGRSSESVIDSPVLTHSVLHSSDSSREDTTHTSIHPVPSSNTPPASLTAAADNTSSSSGSGPLPLADLNNHQDVNKSDTSIAAIPEPSSAKAVVTDSQCQPTSSSQLSRTKTVSLPAPPPVPRRSTVRAQSIPPLEVAPISPKTTTGTFSPSTSNSIIVTAHVSRDSISSEFSSAPTSDEPGSANRGKTTLSSQAIPRYLTRKTSTTGSTTEGEMDLDGLETGWEEKCWCHLIKLKEDMFHKRVGVSIIL
ncbi:uncharacterized protein MELLADRAFT_90485 [Melampsora larici-populina 98AG31]|uniref:GDP/GTP exchange factor Sec2 N-terminal domain-containing protein n=1 Tax=Melampsora larici-populina (strain 98AG31 / pathotype 3-4-7) TaxID=747676 RepID=F4RX28_MELLP|nr:uncharacterized protein MELLADRAFT_90485 [Melampsora larici-populina 98AG31]EGG02888.1 hypothetical protein MELLADRAFT_90485 [Melampsora larici-populina 98AG31]